MSERARTDVESRREIGLFRYSLVRDAADSGLTGRERGRLVRALAERDHVGPDGRPVRVARGTLDQWVRAYRRGGFDALVPQPRRVRLRTPAGMLELAFQLKLERPERTAAQVREIMLASAAGGDRVPGERTLQTHFARQGLNVRADGRTPGKVYGRFEASVRNELWTGDGLHGPKLAGSAARRAVLMAFIDDHSRLLVGWRWGTGEDVFRLEAALRAGLMSRGVPEAILVDRSWTSPPRGPRSRRSPPNDTVTPRPTRGARTGRRHRAASGAGRMARPARSGGLSRAARRDRQDDRAAHRG